MQCIEWQRYLSVWLLPLIHLWNSHFFLATAMCSAVFCRMLRFFFVQNFVPKVCASKTNIHHSEKKSGKTHWNAHSHRDSAHTSSNRHADVSVGAEQAIRILKFTTKKLFKQMRLIYQNTCFPPNKNQFIYNAKQQSCMNEQDWSEREAK